MIDLCRPGSGGDDHVFGSDLAGGNLGARHSPENYVNAVHACGKRPRAEAVGIRSQRTGQGRGVDRAVFWREHGAETGGGRGKTFRNVGGFEPVAAQAGLPLIGHGFPQTLGFGIVERE